MNIWIIVAICLAVLLAGGPLLWALVRWAARITNDELDPNQPKNYGRRRTDRLRTPDEERQEAEARARFQFEMECD